MEQWTSRKSRPIKLERKGMGGMSKNKNTEEGREGGRET